MLGVIWFVPKAILGLLVIGGGFIIAYYFAAVVLSYFPDKVEEPEVLFPEPKASLFPIGFIVVEFAEAVYNDWLELEIPKLKKAKPRRTHRVEFLEIDPPNLT